MKYIYAIIGFIIAVSAGFAAYHSMKNATPEDEIALTINDRVITRKELEHRLADDPLTRDIFAARNRDDALQSIITKELLIQEAQRRGINREESFRRSVQNFYEQSLIKILLERQYAAMNFGTTEEEVNRFLALAAKRLDLEVCSYPDRQQAEKGQNGSCGRRSIHFLDLSNDLKAALVEASSGRTAPVPAADRYETYEILAAVDDPAAGGLPGRDQAAKLLAQYKREKAMHNWLADLKERASIRVYDLSHERETGHER